MDRWRGAYLNDSANFDGLACVVNYEDIILLEEVELRTVVQGVVMSRKTQRNTLLRLASIL